MPKLDITLDEQMQLQQCIETELKSAKRAQNSGKTPQIRDIYHKHEQTLQALLVKLTQAR